jgi:hypothetical protein
MMCCFSNGYGKGMVLVEVRMIIWMMICQTVIGTQCVSLMKPWKRIDLFCLMCFDNVACGSGMARLLRG